MKIVAKYICFIICLALFGCSSVETLDAQEKVTITQEQKKILIQINETDLSSMIYDYFNSNGWKIQEQGETTKQTSEKATFSVKYNLKKVDDPLLGAPQYDGYVTIVDMRSGKFVASIRFKELQEKEIYKKIIDEFEDNVEEVETINSSEIVGEDIED